MKKKETISYLVNINIVCNYVLYKDSRVSIAPNPCFGCRAYIMYSCTELYKILLITTKTWTCAHVKL